MVLSIIICTFNRADLLDLTLKNILNQTISNTDYEVIVVDNCSTDHTRKIVGTYNSSYSNLYYFYEKKQGLSVARNTGIRISQSNHLLFLDDDVTTSSNLLEAYLDEIQKKDNQDVACFGGKILINWEGGIKPDWFPEKFLNLYGHFDFGNEVIEVPYAVGCNMLWRKDILNRLGGFDESLGRKGEVKLASEETVLINKAKKEGYKIKYIPDALVHHWTPFSRQKTGYLYNLCYYLGISEAISVVQETKRPSSRIVLKKILRSIKNYLIFLYKLILCSFHYSNINANRKSNLVYFWGKSLFLFGNISYLMKKYKFF